MGGTSSLFGRLGCLKVFTFGAAVLAGRVVAQEGVTFADIVAQTEFAVAAAEGKPDYVCSRTKPCKLGCCGKLDAQDNGICGLGPEYCGADCFSSCSEKSECDPGWGMQWSAASTCPLNVCCSKYVPFDLFWLDIPAVVRLQHI
ncbi:chitinase [Colletotrichum tofieldiae]|nr:chitinase [Colletotrichum tofieldiae]